MEKHRVLFDTVDWESPLPGARVKVAREGAKQLRLLELDAAFVEPEWCEKGHAGFVVAGELEIDFQGKRVRYPQGSGVVIPAGAASAHKARSLTPKTLLFLVEDI